MPVVPTSARYGEGLDELNRAIAEVATGRLVNKPRRVGGQTSALKRAVRQLTREVESAYPGLPNAQWVALRLLDGDERIAEAFRTGELGELQEPHLLADGSADAARQAASCPDTAEPETEDIFALAASLRWQVGRTSTKS